MKILAIDDQKLVLFPLEICLKQKGYEVISKTNLVSGIEAYNSFQPDLVIVGINMPSTSGLEIIKYIRQVKKIDTAIIVLFGNPSDETITQVFDLGINDYMKKPLSLTEVCLRVKNLIGLPSNKVTATNYKNTIIRQRFVGVVTPR